MGLNIQNAKMLLHENDYKEIYGRVLIIGRQTVTIGIPLLQKSFKAYGKLLEVTDSDIDNYTKISSEGKFIRDETFFAHFLVRLIALKRLMFLIMRGPQ